KASTWTGTPAHGIGVHGLGAQRPGRGTARSDVRLFEARADPSGRPAAGGRRVWLVFMNSAVGGATRPARQSRDDTPAESEVLPRSPSRVRAGTKLGGRSGRTARSGRQRRPPFSEPRHDQQIARRFVEDVGAVRAAHDDVLDSGSIAAFEVD